MRIPCADTHQAKESNDMHSKYLVKINDFVPMSQLLAGYTPGVRMPMAVERAFRRAIAERRRVSTWYSSMHADELDADSDKSHLHFIEILESAFATLRKLCRAYTRPEHPARQEVSNTNTLIFENRFAGLEVENADGRSDEAASEPYPLGPDEHLPSVMAVVIEKDETEIEAEFLFAIECFLMEVQSVRKKVSKTWHTYKTTGYDLTVAALLTNTAIGKCSTCECQRKTAWHLLHRVRIVADVR